MRRQKRREQLLPDGFVIACGIVLCAGSAIMLSLYFILVVIRHSVIER